MKVLQVNCVYKKGSTGKITYDLHKGLLVAGIDSVVCYGRGEDVKEPGVYKVCPEWYSKLNNILARFSGVLYGGCFFSTHRLISIIKREKPDIVHLQCINGYFINIYKIIKWLKNNNIQTVLTLHAEFMYTGGCGHSIDCNQWSNPQGCGSDIKCPYYHTELKSIFFDRTNVMWRKMKVAFEGFDKNLLVTSVSPWLMERAKKSPILKNKRHEVVLNGLDINVFHPYNTDSLRKRYGILKNKVVFHATAYFSTDRNYFKGGWYICELAKQLPEIIFIVAGSYGENTVVPRNMILLGRVNNQVELAKYYSMADLTIIASKRETFSMVVAESLCCGTPVVGFKAGGPEQIAIPDFSSFVEYGDIRSLKEKLLSFITVKEKVEISSINTNQYSVSTMVNEYINKYNMILDE